MKIAQRAVRAQPFHAMSIGARARELESRGIRIAKLSLGEPSFGAPPGVHEAMRATMDGRALPYTPAAGLPALRRACNRELVDTFGGRVVLAPTTPAARYQLDLATALAAWTERTSAVQVATPSNPTGTTIPFPELAAICEAARERGAWRIIDEIYLSLADPAPDGSPARTALEADPEAIIVSSFSKYFGMTGWRLGWLILPEELLTPADNLAVNFFLCASTPTQMAALSCFTPEALAACEDRRLELLARRGLVLDGLERIGLPVPVKPDGAFYAYFDVTGTGLDAWTFCERALEEAHVALTPGRDFGPATGSTHVRLSYAAGREELAEGLERLGDFVAGLGG